MALAHRAVMGARLDAAVRHDDAGVTCDAREPRASSWARDAGLAARSPILRAVRTLSLSLFLLSPFPLSRELGRYEQTSRSFALIAAHALHAHAVVVLLLSPRANPLLLSPTLFTRDRL